jgi:hypothetical protein
MTIAVRGTTQAVRFQPETDMTAQEVLAWWRRRLRKKSIPYPVFAAAFILYAGLTALSAGRSRAPQHAYADNR